MGSGSLRLRADLTSAVGDAGTSEMAPVLGPPSRRSVLAGPLVAAATLVAAVWATQEAGVPLRDPDNVAGRRLGWVVCMVLVLVLLDVAVRAGRRSRTFRPSRGALRAVRRERWSGRRVMAMATAVVSFYLSYLAYRNLKSVVPLLRPEELFDRQLARLDRGLFAGNDPAALLQSLLGTGAPAQVLSVVYVFYIAFVPISLAIALVYSANLSGGLFYATAMSLNWPLGAASYLLLPALGPIYAAPGGFADLPPSGVATLQDTLWTHRLEFLSDPGAAGAAQSIAAFASLHVSMILTAVVAAHLLGLTRRVRAGLWVLLALTVVATIYFGWHYVIDDLAAIVVALAALGLAAVLTGFRPRRAHGRPEP